MRAAALTWYRLRWPREVSAEQLTQVFRLLATTAGWPVVIEATSSPGAVVHQLGLPESRAATVVAQLRATIPGLSVEPLSSRSTIEVRRAVELGLSTRRRSLHTAEVTAVSRAILVALAQVRRDEQLSLQWVLGRPLLPLATPTRLLISERESWLGSLLLAPFRGSQAADGELREALRTKQAEPGWQAVGRIAVVAQSPSRQRQLIGQVVGTLRQAEAPSLGFRVRSMGPKRAAAASVPRWRWPLRLNASELATVAGLPVGASRDLPVDYLGSRLLAPTTVIPRTGRVLGTAMFPGQERPLALSAADGLRHLHVLGPSGVGKSTLLLNLITQDMAAGRAVVVIDPKGDLIADCLARIEPKRLADVVLLDPTDTERPVGLNPLALGGRSPELVADQLLGLFHSLYAAHWGPRTHDILGAALLTLARLPNMTLAAVPLLLTNADFRRRVLPQVVDPIGLEPFWRSYEAWSEAERTAAIAPTLNKLRPLLLRPDMRAIIGQAQPRFDLRQVLTERKLLLVNLAVGQLGPEMAALLGSLIVAMLWDVIQGRSAIPAARRHPVCVVLDEFQSYLHLPTNLADALAMARGLGIGFVLAHQFMHQLNAEMRSAVLANVQSRVAFRLPSEDARLLAADSTLAAEDFQSLGAYESYAQLVARAAVQPWCSLRTLPPVPAISDPATVRAASRAAYGLDRQQVESELETLLLARRHGGGSDLQPRRRSPGGTP